MGNDGRSCATTILAPQKTWAPSGALTSVTRRFETQYARETVAVSTATSANNSNPKDRRRNVSMPDSNQENQARVKLPLSARDAFLTGVAAG
ncbi:MAG: hypothetical protein JNM89_09900 [Hyphomicrobiaceae bacterium]|nr:hypothetical protein [Hyphomicrobiaceae bacterium]